MACRIAGIDALKRHAVGDAHRLFERARRGGDAKAIERLGTLHLTWDEVDEAIACFRAAIAAGDSDAQIALARSLDIDNDIDEIIELLTDADRKGVHGAAGYLGEAHIIGRDDAGAAFEVVRYAEPDDARAAWLATILQLHNDLPEEARTTIDRLPPEFARQDETILLSGVVHEAMGQRAAAIEVLLSSNEDEVEAWVTAAIRSWLEQLAPASAAAAFYLADFARQLAENPDTGTPEADRLRPAYLKAAALGSNTAAQWVARYSSLDHLHRDVVERAAADGQPWALLRMANIQLDEGRSSDDVLHYIERAAATGQLDAVYNLGERVMEADPARAEALLREALERGRGEAAHSLAELIAARRGWDDAEVEVVLGRGAFLGAAAAMTRLAVIHAEKNNDLEEALLYFERADRFGSAEGADGHGLTLMRLHRYEEAETSLLRALDRGLQSSLARIAGLHVVREDYERALLYADRARRHAASSNTAALVVGEIYEKCATSGFGPPSVALAKALDCYRESDAAGSAWAAFRVATLTDGPQAVVALDRAEERATDRRHPYWYMIGDRERLLRAIEGRRRELPTAGSQVSASSSRAIGGLRFTVRLPPR